MLSYFCPCVAWVNFKSSVNNQQTLIIVEELSQFSVINKQVGAFTYGVKVHSN